MEYKDVKKELITDTLCQYFAPDGWQFANRVTDDRYGHVIYDSIMDESQFNRHYKLIRV